MNVYLLIECKIEELMKGDTISDCTGEKNKHMDTCCGCEELIVVSPQKLRTALTEVAEEWRNKIKSKKITGSNSQMRGIYISPHDVNNMLDALTGDVKSSEEKGA